MVSYLGARFGTDGSYYGLAYGCLACSEMGDGVDAVKVLTKPSSKIIEWQLLFLIGVVFSLLLGFLPFVVSVL